MIKTNTFLLVGQLSQKFHNNCSFCDTSMTCGTVMAKGIPKRCGYGAIMNFQNGRQWQLFSYQFSDQGWIFNEIEDLIS